MRKDKGRAGSRTAGFRNFGPVPSREEEGRAEYPYLATARSNALENEWFGSGSGTSRHFESSRMQWMMVMDIARETSGHRVRSSGGANEEERCVCSRAFAKNGKRHA